MGGFFALICKTIFSFIFYLARIRFVFMPIIRIKRHLEFSNAIRNYKVLIDGEVAGYIANGYTKDFEVTAGKHEIAAKVDWCTSPIVLIVIKENETKNLQIEGSKTSRPVIVFLLVSIIAHLVVNEYFGYTYLIYMVALALLLLLYNLTYARKKYLMVSTVINH